MKVLQGLYRGVAGGKGAAALLRAEAEQEQVAGTMIAGELPVEASGDPQVGVYLNDATGSKMSYYLQYDVDVTSRSCAADGRQTLLGRLEISSQTPSEAESLPESVAGFDMVRDPFIKRGQQFVVGDVFAPVAGTIDKVTLDDEPLDPPVLDMLDGRQVASLAFLFSPG